MAIKVQRRYECDNEGCDTTADSWCLPGASVTEGLPEGWTAWLDEDTQTIKVGCDTVACQTAAAALEEESNQKRLRAREEAMAGDAARKAARLAAVEAKQAAKRAEREGVASALKEAKKAAKPSPPTES